jgi:hypothetical protein
MELMDRGDWVMAGGSTTGGDEHLQKEASSLHVDSLPCFGFLRRAVPDGYFHCRSEKSHVSSCSTSSLYYLTR